MEGAYPLTRNMGRPHQKQKQTMWHLYPPNRLCYEYHEKDRQQKHIVALLNVRPHPLDNEIEEERRRPPHLFPPPVKVSVKKRSVRGTGSSVGASQSTAYGEGTLLLVKPKSKSFKRENARNAVITLENKILLEKMLRIDSTPSPYSPEAIVYQDRHFNGTKTKSLNFDSRKKELDRITFENRRLLERLGDVKPSVKPQQWEKERQHTEYIAKNILKNSIRGKPPRGLNPPPARQQQLAIVPLSVSDRGPRGSPGQSLPAIGPYSEGGDPSAQPSATYRSVSNHTSVRGSGAAPVYSSPKPVKQDYGRSPSKERRPSSAAELPLPLPLPYILPGDTQKSAEGKKKRRPSKEEKKKEQEKAEDKETDDTVQAPEPAAEAQAEGVAEAEEKPPIDEMPQDETSTALVPAEAVPEDSDRQETVEAPAAEDAGAAEVVKESLTEPPAAASADHADGEIADETEKGEQVGDEQEVKEIEDAVAEPVEPVEETQMQGGQVEED
ncbi:unnamed protein product [Vitrella brassicaformis CCMP3155]|uniref:Uncharacterized protein n=1 Tax=Vitrella brassicaformis (strain CCMP3155) TaxID=1169540 RepID=A0A0G4H1J1_VITBC|nr:unnamed protein product [Vitrella brassicaformis CCMP3155]|eukprot:CEM37229.1 unnamed protein product [Vitrella brassicaformis CCMP3155]